MANTKVTGDVIANGTISTVHLADDAITAAKLDSTATGITFADLTVDTDTLYVDSANNRVGIGTTSPLNKFDLRGTAYITGYTVGFDTSPQGNYAYRLTNDGGNSFINAQGGNLGIGITSPAYKLQISGVQNQNDIVINNTTTGVNLRLQMIDGYGFMFTTGSKDLLLGTNNTERMRINSSGLARFTVDNSTASAIDIGYVSSARTIRAVETGGGNARPLTLLAQNFTFKDDSATRMLIDSSGLVTIGSSALMIDSANTNFNLEMSDGIAFGGSAYTYANIFGSSGNIVIAANAYPANTGSTATITFKTANSGGSQLTPMIIKGDSIGIGTTSPTNGKLEVQQSATTAALWVQTGGTTDSYTIADFRTGTNAPALAIKGNGNVGIGVSPYSFAQLHIYDTSDIYIAIQKGTANGYIINDGTNISLASDQGSTGKKLLVNRNAPDNSLIIDSSGNSIFVGDVNISNSSGATLNINTSLGAADSKILLHEGSTSSPANGASIRYDGVNNLFKIGVGTNVDTTRLTIARDTGNVGIGTTSMQGKLDVHNTGAASILYVSSDQGNNSTTSILNLGGASGRSASIQGYRAASSNEHELVFKTYSSGQYERMRITSGGEIQATPSASGRAFFSSQANANFSIAYTAWIANASTKVLDVLWYGSTIGSISVNASGTGVNYNTSSDYRLKENVIEMTGALDRVSQLKPSRFNFIADADKTVDGFLAHEVQDIVPEAITGAKDEVDVEGNPVYQGIDQSKLVPLLVGAIQEQQEIINDLKNRIQTLENN